MTSPTPNSQDLRSLPSPAPTPALVEYRKDPLAFLTCCVREYGEIVPIQMEEDLFCLLSNPAHITEVLKDRI